MVASRRTFFRLILSLLLLLFLAFSLLFVASLNSNEARYKLYPDHYRAIFKNDNVTPTVLFLGSSRSQTAVSYDGIQYARRSICGSNSYSDVKYIDFSKSLSGMGIQYVILRDYFKNRKDAGSHTSIFLELKKTNYHQRIHPYFYQTAKFSDIWESSFVTKRNDSRSNKFQDFLKVAFKKIVNAISTKMVGLDYTLNAKVLEVPNFTENIYDPTPSQLIVPDGIVDYEKRKKSKWKGYKDVVWDLSDPYEARILHYAKKILALAEENNASVIFHRVPVIFQPVLDHKATVDLKKLNINLHQPSKLFLEKLYDGHYGDGGHMNKKGSKLYLEWLFGETLSREMICEER